MKAPCRLLECVNSAGAAPAFKRDNTAAEAAVANQSRRVKPSCIKHLLVRIVDWILSQAIMVVNGYASMPESADYRQALADYIADVARPVDKFGHQPRLYSLTRQIGEGHHYDDDVVCAAAWLHDLGVFVGQRPEDPEELARWNHVPYAMQHAPAILQRLGFP